MDYTWDSRDLQVTTLTTARYKGVEGELPFEYWGKEDVLFADLRGHDATFGTIDYSDGAPMLFIGRFVVVRRAAAAQRPQLRGGGRLAVDAGVQLRQLRRGRRTARAGAHPRGRLHELRRRHRRRATATSPSCRPPRRKQSITPLIPLGTRGTWHGQPHDVIGFQQRSIEVDGERYAWDEYVLFNPYHGFRYLTYYNGHWNDVTVVRERPVAGAAGGSPRQAAPWVRGLRGTSSTPRPAPTSCSASFRGACGRRDGRRPTTSSRRRCMLSSEGTDAERTWSLGRYTPPAAIWQAFELP